METIIALVTSLAPIGPYVLIGIVLIILGIIGYLVVVLRGARTGQAPQELGGEIPASAAEAQQALTSPGAPSAQVQQLRSSFAEAVKALKGIVSGPNYRYQIPWYMLVGEAASGKSTLLNHTGLTLPLGKPGERGRGTGRGCQWWLFDEGIVLDLAGDYVLRADGKSSDERGWHTVLRLLQKYRPQRPIDGVILTIPCTDLIGPQRLTNERLTKAEEKATLLYAKLWQAQRTLGLCVPVYLLVTKCDQLPGFRSFCSEIPERLQDDVFGWSSPYGLETAYTAGWMDEAFQSLHRNLHQTQLEVFAEREGVHDSDGLFLFPSALQSMAEVLRVYVNTLFRQSVYHESFFFRGLYFCGDGSVETFAPTVLADETAAVPPSPASPAELASPSPAFPPKPVFLKHLFDQKIFPESGLARPASRTLLMRNRTTLVAQGLMVLIVLVGGLGLWRAYARLSVDKQTLLPVLTEIEKDTRAIQDITEKKRQKLDPALIQDHTLDLLKGMASIRTGRLDSLFIPSSWFSPLHEQVADALVKAYNAIILKGMYYGLNDKAREILRGQPVAAPDAGEPKVVFIWETPEFTRLRALVDDVEEFEKQSANYQVLATPNMGGLEGLGQVVKYLFSADLPPDFYENSDYYENALKAAQYKAFDPTIFKEEATLKVREFMRPLYQRLFDSNLALAQLLELTRKLESLKQESKRESWVAENSVRMLRELLPSINRAQTALAKPEFAWLSNDTFDLGKSFNEMLDAIQKSKLLGSELRVEMQKSGEAGFQKLKAEIERQQTSLSGPVLQRQDGKVQLQLSTDLLALKVALEDFLNMKLMSTAFPKTVTKPKFIPRSRLVWNTKSLEEALRLHKPYDLFIKDGLKSFPADLENLVTHAARYRLEVGMNDLIAQAQDFSPLPGAGARFRLEEYIRIELKSFKEATKFLSQLLDIFDQVGLAVAYADLADIVASQAYTLLGAVDQLLGEDGLYTIKDGNFAWWNGAPPLSLTAFDVRDATELSQYLDLQRERAKYLAREYTEPLVTFLGSKMTPRDQNAVRLVSRWQGILAELDKYESKKPGNSVLALEKFILSEMDEISTENCFQKIPSRDLAAPAGDFFLSIRNSLRRELYKRCQVLANQEAFKTYTEIQDLFNRRLAGKFPFSESAVGRNPVEADPDAIRDFYRLFDRNMKAGREVLKSNLTAGVSGEQALEFLEQMEGVRAFFAPFLEGGSKAQAPVFDVDIEFRVNQEQESGGNQIIDWSMDVGEQKFRMDATERHGRWRVGTPIRLSLRWAKDAPIIPASDGTQPGVTVADRTVVYEYTNRWSLLSLLRRHWAFGEDFDQRDELQPHTLKFVIRTRTDGGATSLEPPLPGGSQTRVFMRVALTSPDKKEGMVLPRFPKRAPQLSQRAQN
ncbi:MAG: hypothetical protein HYZ81_16070 [Nitrospinae bacterium]|nr:hypothetical protein [Nitrospinota bacterium]